MVVRVHSRFILRLLFLTFFLRCSGTFGFHVLSH